MIQPSFFSVLNIFDRETPIAKLHRAAEAWDVQTALEAVQELESDGNECDKILAAQMRNVIDIQGESGLNHVNAMQVNVERRYPNCSYPLLEHPDQSWP